MNPTVRHEIRDGHVITCSLGHAPADHTDSGHCPGITYEYEEATVAIIPDRYLSNVRVTSKPMTPEEARERLAHPIPWDQPGADPVADMNAFIEVARSAPYEPHVPLLSPRCGLDGHIDHAACRSVICECPCHAAVGWG